MILTMLKKISFKTREIERLNVELLQTKLRLLEFQIRVTEGLKHSDKTYIEQALKDSYGTNQH